DGQRHREAAHAEERHRAEHREQAEHDERDADVVADLVAGRAVKGGVVAEMGLENGAHGRASLRFEYSARNVMRFLALYSCLNACTGSTARARRAGTHAAPRAATTMRTAAPAVVHGSPGRMP